MMKITVEHLGNKVTVVDESAHDICDAIDLMEKALLKIGYEPERIKGGFLYKAGEIEKVAVLAIRVFNVAVAMTYGCRGQYGDGVLAHHAHQLPASTCELVPLHMGSV